MSLPLVSLRSRCHPDAQRDGCRIQETRRFPVTNHELAVYPTDTYCAEGKYLFAKYPSFLVLRHKGNRRWFAVIMDIPRKNLRLPGVGEISAVNLKCDTRLISPFCEESGIFPGWHMNKAHWRSVALNGTAEDEKIKFLVDMSYELTK